MGFEIVLLCAGEAEERMAQPRLLAEYFPPLPLLPLLNSLFVCSVAQCEFSQGPSLSPPSLYSQLLLKSRHIEFVLY